MAVSLGPALWQDGPTYSGETVRQMDVASGWFCDGTVDALTVRAGVVNNTVGSLQVLPVSGMSIKVASGFAIVPSTASNIDAAYKIGTMTSVSLTVPTADGTNPRIDMVVIYVDENGDDTSAGYIDIIEGTPAFSPVPPIAPANSLVLATIAVAANSVSVSSTNITDQRVYTTAAGGVIPWPDMTLVTAGHPGLIAYDTANNRFFHNASNAPVNQLRVLPWAPVSAIKNANWNLTADTPTVWASASITTDGGTDIKITTHWCGLVQATTGPRSVIFSVFLDGNELDATSIVTPNSGLSNVASSGGTSVYSTGSATGDTPSAGTHTVYAKAYCAVSAGGGSGSVPAVYATTSRNAYLRVEPVIL